MRAKVVCATNKRKHSDASNGELNQRGNKRQAMEAVDMVTCPPLQMVGLESNEGPEFVNVVLDNTIASAERKRGRRKKIVASSERPERILVTACRPARLHNLIKRLTQRQIEDVKEIGFGGLLKLCMTETSRVMLPWLIDSFNGTSRILTLGAGKEFVITPDDVYDVFCLPRNRDNKVLEISHVRKGESPDSHLRSEWKNRFGVKGDDDIKLHKLSDVMIDELKEGGDDFKRFFVMFAMSSFLAPIANRNVDLKIVKSLEDVSQIGNLDWCGYVLDKLCDAVESYKNNLGKKNVSGCVTVLQVVYFHRLVFQGDAAPCELPLIQHWSDRKVRDRLALEMKSGGFGKGVLEPSIYPVSRSTVSIPVGVPLNRTKLTTVTTAGAREVLTGVQVQPRATDCIPMVGPRKAKKFVSFELPEGAFSNEEIHILAKDDTHEEILLLKRDMDVIFDFHMRRLSSMRDCYNDSGVSLSQTQGSLCDLEVQSYIDQVVEKMLVMKKTVEEMPSFELMSSQETADEGHLNSATSSSDQWSSHPVVSSPGVDMPQFYEEKTDLTYLPKVQSSLEKTVVDVSHKDIVHSRDFSKKGDSSGGDRTPDDVSAFGEVGVRGIDGAQQTGIRGAVVSVLAGKGNALLKVASHINEPECSLSPAMNSEEAARGTLVLETDVFTENEKECGDLIVLCDNNSDRETSLPNSELKRKGASSISSSTRDNEGLSFAQISYSRGPDGEMRKRDGCMRRSSMIQEALMNVDDFSVSIPNDS